MTITKVSEQCWKCPWFYKEEFEEQPREKREVARCASFPEGVPSGILDGKICSRKGGWDLDREKRYEKYQEDWNKKHPILPIDDTRPRTKEEKEAEASKEMDKFIGGRKVVK